MGTMKAVRMHSYGGSEVLVYEDVPRPEPAAGEVLVRVRAASVNPVDIATRVGYMRSMFGFDPPLPLIMGVDFAGDVEAVGSEVTGYQAGDAVFGKRGLGRGTYAEYITVSMQEVALKPVLVDYVAAAAVPLAAITAWQSLVEIAQLVAGQRVLIYGAAGGVGSFAAQIARARGAYVIGVVHGAHADLLRELGADQVIDSPAAPLDEIVDPVDVVLDLVGGESQAQQIRLLKPGGMLVTPVGLGPGITEAAAAAGVRAEMVVAPDHAGYLTELGRLIDAGQMRPIVGQRFLLAEAAWAQDLKGSGHLPGKIVLTTDGV